MNYKKYGYRDEETYVFMKVYEHLEKLRKNLEPLKDTGTFKKASRELDTTLKIMSTLYKDDDIYNWSDLHND
tara:strand:+ start:519 stop:734 length:216 start_codon:yes stop_codon:yes gene_type:complete